MDNNNIYKMVLLAKEELIDMYDKAICWPDEPDIQSLTWAINGPHKANNRGLYRWVYLITQRCGYTYSGNLDEWSIPSTKYVLEVIEKMAIRRICRGA